MTFTRMDESTAEEWAVIGAETARKWWPGRSPIGDSIKIGGEHSWRIVGIAADVHTHSLVDTGNIVHASDTTGIGVITHMQPITALFTIPQYNLPVVLKLLKAGQRVPGFR